VPPAALRQNRHQAVIALRARQDTEENYEHCAVTSAWSPRWPRQSSHFASGTAPEPTRQLPSYQPGEQPHKLDVTSSVSSRLVSLKQLRACRHYSAYQSGLHVHPISPTVHVLTRRLDGRGAHSRDTFSHPLPNKKLPTQAKVKDETTESNYSP
jgi:hypothetical protein